MIIENSLGFWGGGNEAVLFILRIYPSKDLESNYCVLISLCVVMPTSWTYRLICYTFILGISFKNIVAYNYVKYLHVPKQIHKTRYIQYPCSLHLIPPLPYKSFKFYFMLYPFIVFAEYKQIHIYLCIHSPFLK